MSDAKFKTYKQTSAYKSARPKRELIGVLLWEIAWNTFCVWTPKPFNGWRLMWLKLFGAKIYGKPFVHQRARIEVPWNLIMHDRSCLGDRANAYSLDIIELMPRSTVAQESYLCTGTHKFDDPNLPLQTAKITIAEDAFLGARTFVLPGITIGAGTITGAGSVVTTDLPEWTICAGNPCKPIKRRERQN